MKPHSTILLLMISLASLVYALPALAQNGDMAVVVNAKNSVNNLTVTELRNLFGGYKHSWPGGTAVKIFVAHPAHKNERHC